ncbi:MULTISPECIES: T9SS type A sorting domain-containing protein [Flavobacterium]|uniref:T9SS type A sorting domain-containing protein n=1 Tax=Flavobacterium TaxID=237 RepID=UPI001FCC5D2B|nr:MULTISPECIES: T9SS type A sorting domain-containing protein [Flavobacterium]UOK42814.1 T9SS type A sorting domain-containing protein [Flavobacterium enshiense]
MKKFYLLIICVLGLGNAFPSFAQGAPQLQWVFNAVNNSAPEAPSIGRSVATDTFGNVYVAGEFFGTADFDPSAAIATLTSTGTDDIFIAKYDGNGNYLWAKAIGGAGEDWVSSLLVNSSGGLHITGHFEGTADFDPSSATANLTCVYDSDLYIAKYDNNGNYLWAKSMGGADSNYEYPLAFAISNSGELCVAGRFNGLTDFDPSGNTVNLNGGDDDTFIAKYDANGNYLWAKHIAGNGTSEPTSLVLNSIGELYVTGRFNDTFDFDPSVGVVNLVGTNDFFIAKYDSNGNYLWAKGIGGPSGDIGYSIALNNNGDIYVTGAFRSTVDFDPSAGIANLSSAGAGDIFIAKYDSNGNYLSAKAMGGTNGEAGRTIRLNSSGELYLIGNFFGTADFDPSAGIANLSSAGAGDVFMAKYDSNGNYLWAKAVGGIGNEVPWFSALNNNGDLYVTGYFDATADFDPSISCGTLTSMNDYDFFLAKYTNDACTAVTAPTVMQTGNTLTVNSTADAYQWIDCNNGNNSVQGATNQSFTPAVNGNYAVVLTTRCCQSTSACQTVVLGVNDEEMALVTLYPNPTTGNFTISWAGELESAEIVVTDIMGKTIKTMQCEGQQEARLSLDGAANGIYFVRLQSGQKTKQFKLIKK